MIEQENLEILVKEKSSLGRNLRLAIEASDSSEITRLKQRERVIDDEIFAAEIIALDAQILQLEAQVSIDRQNIARAQELSKETDSLVISQTSVLREEIKKLNDDAFAKLVAVKNAERQLTNTGAKLSELKGKLSKLLN